VRIPRPGETFKLCLIFHVCFGLLIMPGFWITRRLITITDPFLLALSAIVPATVLAWWFAFSFARRRLYPD